MDFSYFLYYLAKDLFEWPDTFHGNPGNIPDQLAFSGLRVHAPMHPAAMPEEFLLFHGASYFRSRGDGEWYGYRYGLKAYGPAQAVVHPYCLIPLD